MKRSPLKRKKLMKRKTIFKPFPMGKFTKGEMEYRQVKFSEPLPDKHKITFSLKRSKKKIARLRPEKRKSRAAFRKAVMAKNGGNCCFCEYEHGLVHRADDPHHLLPVGRSGHDDPKNGVPLCRTSHNAIHYFPGRAEEMGWLLKSGEQMNENARKIRAWMEGRK